MAFLLGSEDKYWLTPEDSLQAEEDLELLINVTRRKYS